MLDCKEILTHFRSHGHHDPVVCSPTWEYCRYIKTIRSHGALQCAHTHTHKITVEFSKANTQEWWRNRVERSTGPTGPNKGTTAPKSFLLQKHHAQVSAWTSEEADGFHTKSKQRAKGATKSLESSPKSKLNRFLHLIQYSFLNITADYIYLTSGWISKSLYGSKNLTCRRNIWFWLLSTLYKTIWLPFTSDFYLIIYTQYNH